MISVTRRYRFPASHRLHSPQLSEAENARIFGKCNNPFGHGHDYVLEVTAAGSVNPDTGLILPLSKLDRLVQETVLRRFAYRNLNLDLPEFAETVPTTENMALLIARLLERFWTAYLPNSNACLLRVHIRETDRNGFEVLPRALGQGHPRDSQTEEITIHA